MRRDPQFGLPLGSLAKPLEVLAGWLTPRETQSLWSVGEVETEVLSVDSQACLWSRTLWENSAMVNLATLYYIIYCSVVLKLHRNTRSVTTISEPHFLLW